MPILILLRRVDAARAAGLAHPPQLGQRQPDRVEELEHLDGRGRRADVDRLDLVEARASRAAPRRSPRRPSRPARRAPRGPPRRAAPGAPCAIAGVERRVHRLRCSSGCPATIVSRPAFSFSQIRGHREEPAGPHFGQVGEHLAGVVAAGDLQPVDDRQVVVGGALGDVRARAARRSRARRRGTRSARRAPRPRPAGCGGSAARPSAARSCRRCRSASARRSA